MATPSQEKEGKSDPEGYEPVGPSIQCLLLLTLGANFVYYCFPYTPVVLGLKVGGSSSPSRSRLTLRRFSLAMAASSLMFRA